MSVTPTFPKYESWCHQKCPLCGMSQPVVMNGSVFVAAKGFEVPDRGYSFCNCKNIWFTDWSNIDQNSYSDQDYVDGHKGNYYVDEINKFFAHYQKEIEANLNGGRRMLDLGAVVPHLLDIAKLNNFETVGLDIVDHPDFKHELIVADFDKMTMLGVPKFDIIFCNHFLEHIRRPIDAISKCYHMLNPGGLLFVSMPDPFQINWNEPKLWGNWILRQHYIMWDMDSFCEEAEKAGFETIFKRRNLEVRPLRDMHVLLKRP